MSAEQRPAAFQFGPLDHSGAGARSAESWWRQPASVRDLIAELAQIEDAVRRTPTFVVTPSDGGLVAVNPEIFELLDRESRVVRTLRGRRILSSRVEGGPGGPRRGLDGSW
jgi:hypothetical protein